MKRKILLLAGAALSLTAIAVGCIIVWAQQIVSALRPQLEQQLSKVLETKVELGEIRLSLLPSTELQISEVSLRPPGSSKGGLTLKNVSAAASLRALLSKRLEINDLTVSSPVVTLIRNESGVFIEGLEPDRRAPSTPRPPPPPQEESPQGAAAAPLEIDLDRIAIAKGTFVFDDRKTGRLVRMSNLDFVASLTIEGKSVLVERASLDGMLEGLGQIGVTAGDVVVDAERKAVKLARAKVKIPSGAVELSGDISDSGELRFSTKDFSLTPLLEKAPAYLPAMAPLTGVDIVLAGSEGSVDLGKKSLVLKDTTVSLPGGRATLSGTASFASGLEGRFGIAGSGLDIATVYPIGCRFVPAAAGYDPTGRADLALELKLTSSRGAGESPVDVSGKVTVADVSAKLKTGQVVTNAKGPLDLHITPPVVVIKSSALTGSVNGQPIEAAASLRIDSKGVNVQLDEAQGLGGRASGPLSVLFTPEKPMSVKPHVRNMELAKVLAVVKPDMASTFSGTIASFKGDLSLPVGGAGVQALNGGGDLVFVEGLLKGFNLPAAVLKKLDFIGESILEDASPEFKQILSEPDTRIKKLVMSFSATKGMLRLSRLEAEGEVYSLTSAGTRSMSGELDLDATFSFSPEFSEVLARKIKEVKSILIPGKGLTFPLKISGVPPKLIVTPDLEKVLSLAAEKVLKEKASKAIDKALGDKVDPELKEALGGLLGF